ncbi:uncharacterized protein LOC116344378 [Contarinia nasturtii]|uniref:uncharacterized protein LOC116344378 n=1 Tax=Contarinia nasturtii TaxID=265458 RepID=UPI0012D3AFD2|nr:uncharacterized protein LOC116344378 [Contarinia nasturtii]
MIRCNILSIVLFTIQFLRTNSDTITTPNYDKEIEISCVSINAAEEFDSFHLKYDSKMAKYNFKFLDGEIEKIKLMIGNRKKLILFFLGNQAHLHSASGRQFRIAKEQMQSTNSSVRTISYEFLSEPDIFKDLLYFSALKYRVPRVVEMATSFIQNIVDANDFQINLSSVYLSGYCLGGHIAGNVGLALKNIYNGQMVPAVWAFDAPHIGFPYPIEEGKPRRVQKGDGQLVTVFHTSWIGGKENIADVDVILNDGVHQPGCENESILSKCNHQAAYILYQLIIQKSFMLPTNEKGIPFAHSKANLSNQFPLDFTNPPSNQSGVYYILTADIFGSN